MGREKKTFVDWFKIQIKDIVIDEGVRGKDCDIIVNLETIDSKINPYKTLLTYKEYVIIFAKISWETIKNLKEPDRMIFIGSIFLVGSNKENAEKYYSVIIKGLHKYGQKKHKTNIKLVEENIRFVELYRKKKTSSQKYSHVVYNRYRELKKEFGVKEAVKELKKDFPNNIEVQKIKNPYTFNRAYNDYITRHKYLI